MRIVYVSPYYDPAVTDPDAILAAFPILRELPPAVAGRGQRVKVLLHAPERAKRWIGEAEYRFIPPGPVSALAGRALHRWKPRYGPAYYQPAFELVRLLTRLRPDVVHLFGLTMDIQLALVSRAVQGIGADLFVHYHGGVPASAGNLRRLQRHNLARVDRVLFTTADQADAWVEAGLIDSKRQLARVVETSSPFRGMAKDEARAVTGMHGDPVLLSAGRLHQIKDPLTTVRGFERIAAERPNARLYLYFLSEELLPEIRDLVASVPGLAERVEFRGRAPLEEMEAIYSSADFLLQSSRREWSGLAVLEAMSCGCIPVVTRIPSFEMMTGGGRFGRLFEPGDADGLAQAVLDLDAGATARLSGDVKAHFERELSFTAIAGQLDRLYRESRSGS